MSESNSNSYLPSSGVELNLASPDSGDLGAQWDANAKTHLTNGQASEGYRGDDYVPQRERSFPGMAQGLPQIGGHYLDTAPAADSIGGDGLDVERPRFNGSLAILLFVLLVLGAWLVGPSLGFDMEEALVSVFSEAEDETYDVVTSVPPQKRPRKFERHSGAQSTQGFTPQHVPELSQGMQGSNPNLAPNNPLPTDGVLTYQYIPTPELKVEPLGRVWSAEEDENWRNGIHHRFAWQRYKTVMDVRTARLTQSNIILWDALEDEKFWVRMRALMGLAEFGVPVAGSNIQRALNGVSEAQMEHFFKRFHRASTGERYVLRQTVALVPASVRLTILKALSQAGDSHVGLYLTAAISDPAPAVQRWASGRLAHYQLALRQAWAQELAGLRRQPLPQAQPVPQAPVEAAAPRATPRSADSEKADRMPLEHLKTYQNDEQENASAATAPPADRDL